MSNVYLHFPGVYLPLTMEGNIVVDGVLVSCHAVVDHDIAQIGTKPIQWYRYVLELVFGDENGVSVYINVAKTIGRWLFPQCSEII